jgi:hypothetical protein
MLLCLRVAFCRLGSFVSFFDLLPDSTGRLRVTPAMEAGLAIYVWSLEEIVRLLY